VYTETGLPLSGERLRYIFRQYIGGIGGLSKDMSRVTVMTVRASYASMMSRSFRKGAFPGQSGDQFLCDLAEVMNISTEMLRGDTMLLMEKSFMRPPVLFCMFQGRSRNKICHPGRRGLSNWRIDYFWNSRLHGIGVNLSHCHFCLGPSPFAHGI
jgi:hypothetical protein